MARRANAAPKKADVPETKGKRVEFDQETWQALDVLARERMMTFQELADEAFRDVLRKHNRPYDTLDAFRKSAKAAARPAKESKASAKPAANEEKKKQQPQKKTARQGGGRARS